MTVVKCHSTAKHKKGHNSSKINLVYRLLVPSLLLYIVNSYLAETVFSIFLTVTLNWLIPLLAQSCYNTSFQIKVKFTRKICISLVTYFQILHMYYSVCYFTVYF